MRKHMLVLSVCGVFAAQYARAQSQIPCDPQMFKDYVSDTYHLGLTIAVLRLINKSNYDSFKNGFNANVVIPIAGVPVDFGASYQSLDQKRIQLFKYYKFDETLDSSRRYVQFRFSDSGYKYYRECLRDDVLNKDGLHAFIVDPSETSFIARFLWRPPAGPASAKRVYVSVQAGTGKPMSEYMTIEPNGTRQLTVMRDPSKETRVVVTDNGRYADDILVPATPPLLKNPTPVRCFWRHTLQFMNNINDARLQTRYPKIYST